MSDSLTVKKITKYKVLSIILNFSLHSDSYTSFSVNEQFLNQQHTALTVHSQSVLVTVFTEPLFSIDRVIYIKI